MHFYYFWPKLELRRRVHHFYSNHDLKAKKLTSIPLWLQRWPRLDQKANLWPVPMTIPSPLFFRYLSDFHFVATKGQCEWDIKIHYWDIIRSEKLLVKENLQSLPILNEEERCVGFVEMADIIRWLVDKVGGPTIQPESMDSYLLNEEMAPSVRDVVGGYIWIFSSHRTEACIISCVLNCMCSQLHAWGTLHSCNRLVSLQFCPLQKYWQY